MSATGAPNSPSFPTTSFRSLLIITLDIFVIRGVAAHGGAMREPL